MSDQYPSGGGPAGSDAAEPRIRGAFGELGEPVQDNWTAASEQARAADSDITDEDGDGDGDGETLPPSPDHV